MKEAILIIAVLGVFVYGYFLMARLDKFLDENRNAIEKEQEVCSTTVLTQNSRKV